MPKTIIKKPQHQDYRICYEGGNSVKGEKIYELYKYCKCSSCIHRFTYTRDTQNKVTATTKDILKVNEVAEFLKSWTCEDGNKQLEISYFKF